MSEQGTIIYDVLLTVNESLLNLVHSVTVTSSFDTSFSSLLKSLFLRIRTVSSANILTEKLSA